MLFFLPFCDDDTFFLLGGLVLASAKQTINVPNGRSNKMFEFLLC